MRCHAIIGRPNGLKMFGLILVVVLSTGCSSPPSVVALLQVVDKAIEQEKQFVAEDQQTLTVLFKRQKQSLDVAYEADLVQQKQLDKKWIIEHTQVYLIAREVLLENHLSNKQWLARRQENLELTQKAQRRAILLLEQHNQLWQTINPLQSKLNQLNDYLAKESHYE